MNLVLFYAPNSCALVPFITLTEAGAQFDVRALDMRHRRHPDEEFDRINPKRKVPVLVIGDWVLTENVAIQQWIARQYPAARLLPDNSMDEFKAISLMAWCASAIHPHLTPNVRPERYCDVAGSEDSVRRCAQKLLHEDYRIADDLLKDREWFFEGFTAPDAYFFWCFRRGKQIGLDVSAYPNCEKHFERMIERPSVQKLLAFETATLEAFAKA